MKTSGTLTLIRNEGIGSIPGVVDVPTDESEEEISWNSIDEKGDDDEGKDGDGDDEGNDGDDSEEGDDDDEQDDDARDDDEEEDKDERDNKEDDQEEGNGEENLGTNVGMEEGHDEEEEEDELYRDANINLGRELIHVITICDKYAQSDT
uniref:Uncharacterized protein n=1 Tax=Tanacetum cinerariifolium TaxID=118510 RepID=A0A6L2L9L4_TANCI|nr:hypothetical protein [Tanacetum cinerariifolium]